MNPLESLSNQDLLSLCREMDITTLQNLLLITEGQYDICRSVLQEKLYGSADKRVLRNAILNRLNQLPPGKVLNVSNMDNQGKGMRITDLPRETSRFIQIPGYNIVVIPERYPEIVDILTTR